MYAITLHQPWASLIALGVKTVETRSWPASARLVGQTIAIHAGKRVVISQTFLRFLLMLPVMFHLCGGMGSLIQRAVIGIMH